MEGVSAVVHVASIIETATTDPRLLHAVNVGGTKNVVEACREKGVSALVYTSSGEPQGFLCDTYIL